MNFNVERKSLPVRKNNFSPNEISFIEILVCETSICNWCSILKCSFNRFIYPLFVTIFLATARLTKQSKKEKNLQLTHILFCSTVYWLSRMVNYKNKPNKIAKALWYLCTLTRDKRYNCKRNAFSLGEAILYDIN